MKKGTATQAPKYNWKEIREKIVRGTNYDLGVPFNYRHQLRIKATPSWVCYTFWDYNQCVKTNMFQGEEKNIWEELQSDLAQQGILAQPCVGVSISVWNDFQVLFRPEANPTLALTLINRALRTQPETIRRDLSANGIYSYTAMECDEKKLFIFGLPLGYTVKEMVGRFPTGWATAIWFGPVALPFYQAFTQKMDGSNYHTVLTKGGAINLMIQNGVLRFFQQDKSLTEEQPISANSLTKFKNIYSYFQQGEIRHVLHPIDVSLTWVNTLRTCIQSLNWVKEIMILPPTTLGLPNLPDNLVLQDMFPTGMPWREIS